MTSADDAAGDNEPSRAAAAPETSGQHQQRSIPFRSATFNNLSSSSRFLGGHTAQHGELVNRQTSTLGKLESHEHMIRVMSRHNLAPSSDEDMKKERSKNDHQKGEEDMTDEKPKKSKSLSSRLSLGKMKNVFRYFF